MITKSFREVDPYYIEEYKLWEKFLEEKSYDEAMNHLLKSAEGDYAPALGALACHLFEGDIYPQNMEAAERYARRGAALGDDGSQLWLGQILKKKGNNEEALRWFTASGQQGQGWSAYLAGEMFEKGLGTKADLDEAIRWYRMSAKTTNFYASKAKKALERLNVTIFDGNEYLERAQAVIVPGNLSADELYNKGIGWKRSYDPEQLSYLMAAVIKKHPKAAKELGNLFCSSDAKSCGIYNEEMAEVFTLVAMDLYMELVDKGEVEGFYEVGLMYNSGKKMPRSGKVVIEKDLDLAEKYFRMGAERGHDGCQLWLGLTLKEKGRYQEALEWFMKAGEQGQGWASYLAGEMYEKGEGVSRDKKQAIYWYGESAKTNNFYAGKAKEALKRLQFRIFF